MSKEQADYLPKKKGQDLIQKLVDRVVGLGRQMRD
jgi:hypothetical protein